MPSGAGTIKAICLLSVISSSSSVFSRIGGPLNSDKTVNSNANEQIYIDSTGCNYDRDKGGSCTTAGTTEKTPQPVTHSEAEMRNETTMHQAAWDGNVEKTKELLELGADVNVLENLGETALHKAAWRGHLELVKHLVQKGSKVNLQNYRGDTPLHLASYQGYSDTVEYLVNEAKAEVNLKSNIEETPLHKAAVQGHARIVKILLSAGSDVDSQQIEKNTPLHLAARGNHLKAAEYLVNEGHAKLELRNVHDETPLLAAVHVRGNNDVIRFLVEKGAYVNAEQGGKGNVGTSLHIAAWEGDVDLARFLVSVGVDVNALTRSKEIPLHKAAWQGKLEVTKFLVDKGSKINARQEEGNTPLHFASRQNHLNVAEYLVDTAHADMRIKNRIDQESPFVSSARTSSLDVLKFLVERGTHLDCRSKDGGTALHRAAETGNATVVQFLLKHINVDAETKRKETPLHIACIKGYLEIVKILIDAGSDADKKQEHGDTALHLASSEDHLPIVKFLLDRGKADVDLVNDEFATPLHEAVSGESLEIVDCLLIAGSDVDAKDINGLAPLHMTAWNGDFEIAKRLVDGSYAEIDVRNKMNETPLHRASSRGHLEFVQYLVQKGAKVNSKNYKREGPLHYAAQEGHLDVVKFLVENGAKTNARDSDNETPLKKAKIRNHTDIVSYLQLQP